MGNKQPLKVWVIPSFYWSEDYPLRGVFFKEQAEAIHNQGIDITIIYPELRSLFDFKIKNGLKFHFQKFERLENGLRVIRKRRWNFFKTNEDYSIGYRLWKMSVIQIVRGLIEKDGKPDIIHAHNVLGAGIAAKEIKEKWNIPYIITEHSTMFYGNISNHSDLYIDVYRQANKVVAVSTDLASTIKSKLGITNEIITIPNFIDTEYFNIQLTKKAPDTFVFFTLCHLVPRKRVEKIIEAFSKLLLKYPEKKMKLIIGGKGEERKSLDKLVADLNIISFVNFEGEVSREKAVQLFNNSDVFVLASDHETFGVVLIEAMSCGIPIVSTKSGGPSDIVDEECGILVDNDINSIFNGIEDMLTNSSRYDRNKIRQIATEKFSNKAIASKYISIYNSVNKLK